MKTELLFYLDAYLSKFEAAVDSVRPDGGIILDETAFYYASAGQPSDKGKLIRKSDDALVEIGEEKKVDGEVVHYPAAALAPATAASASPPSSTLFSAGDPVSGELDWERRHRLMRMHTAGHALAAGLFKHHALVTGTQLEAEQSRFDFSVEQFDRALFDQIVAETNAEMAAGHEVKTYSLPREEALKMPGMVKLANVLPPALTMLRIVELVGLDTQADGGTHVKNTNEVGTIQIVKLDNKGAKNKRIYFSLKP